MHRTRRIAVSWLGIVALLFAQLAVSAYACPMSMDAGTTAGIAAVPCGEADMDQADLCEKHCNDSPQVQSPAASLPLGFVAAFVLHLDRACIAAPSLAGVRPVPLRATSSPPAIRNCCLRI